MTGRITEHTVQGKTYKVFADYNSRCMYAQNEAGEIKRIHGSGYLSKDLTIRKAIRYAYGLDSFRK